MERKYLKAWKKFLDENTESVVENIDEDLNEQEPDKDDDSEKKKKTPPRHHAGDGPHSDEYSDEAKKRRAISKTPPKVE
jgi:type II secretory pathway component PulK